MDKIQRAESVLNSMNKYEMALRIVEMEDEIAAAIDAMNMARKAIDESTTKFAEYSAKLDGYDNSITEQAKRITELQDALELAEEAVRAKQVAAVPEGWQLVPVVPTAEMLLAAAGEVHSATYWGPAYRSMLAAAPKLGGE